MHTYAQSLIHTLTHAAHISRTHTAVPLFYVDNMQREGNNESNLYSINYCRLLLALQLEAVLNRVTSETTNCGHTIRFLCTKVIVHLLPSLCVD